MNRMSRQNTEDLGDMSETVLCDTITVDTTHYAHERNTTESEALT